MPGGIRSAGKSLRFSATIAPAGDDSRSEHMLVVDRARKYSSGCHPSTSRRRTSAHRGNEGRGAAVARYRHPTLHKLGFLGNWSCRESPNSMWVRRCPRWRGRELSRRRLGHSTLVSRVAVNIAQSCQATISGSDGRFAATAFRRFRSSSVLLDVVRRGCRAWRRACRTGERGVAPGTRGDPRG